MSGSRFEALSDRAEDSEREVIVAARPRRRLVLLSQNADPVASDHEWDPDTESLEGFSDVEEEDVPEAPVLETQFWRRESKFGPGRSLLWIR